jgi:hypothetical protein
VYAAKAGKGENVNWDELDPKDYKTKAQVVSLMDDQVSATYVIDITTSGGMCVGTGAQCNANHPCCAGLQYVPASTRAFCR